MMIIGLIKSALKSLELYLKLKNKTIFFDIEERHNTNQEKLINEIEKLRSTGTSNDAHRADLLLNKLLKERRRFESLYAAIIEIEGGDSDKNN